MNGSHASALVRSLAAAYEPTRKRRRPELGLDLTRIGDRVVAVRERAVSEHPFFRLVHLQRDARREDPRVLAVPPLSGHFPALMRDIFAALMPDHDIYLIDWADARDVPLAAGSFGLEENIATVIDCFQWLGGAVHLIALCQSAMPALAATALLAARRDAEQPRSLTLVNGMIDPRIKPTRIDRLAAGRSVAWFERHTIAAVPPPYAGEGRSVYPAALQHRALFAYLMRHVTSGEELLGKLLHDDGEDASQHPFFEVFLSVMDLSAAFFLDTIRLVFHEFALPQGRLVWRGAAVDPAAITETALMTVEGERDDVSSPGQTRIAHELCRNVPGDRRVHYVQPGVGHFGTFHGRIWRAQVMPRIRAFIREMH